MTEFKGKIIFVNKGDFREGPFLVTRTGSSEFCLEWISECLAMKGIKHL